MVLLYLHKESDSELNGDGAALLFPELGKSLHDFLKDDRNMKNKSEYKYLM